MKKKVNPMLDIPRGLTTHPSMKAPAEKLLTDFHRMRGELYTSLLSAGVSKKSALKSLDGDIDLYEKVKEKKVVVATKKKKGYTILSGRQKAALKADRRFLSAKKLAEKYGVSLGTVYNICNG